MYKYQEFATERILTNPQCGLFLDMGLGKTVCSLTAIDILLYDRCMVSKPLIVAPKRVTESTWTDEVGEWAHLKHLTISVVTGDEPKRLKALLTPADIYAINRENVVWLVDLYKDGLKLKNSWPKWLKDLHKQKVFKKRPWPFDMVVIDELSSFKAHNSQRFKALKSVRDQINWITGLTGTPNPNGYLDLWPQVYLLDKGERLGKSFSLYKATYFTPGRGNGQIVFDWNLIPGGEALIQSKISDICVSMKTEDYLELPDRIDHFIKVRLSDEEMAAYKQFEKELVMELPEDGEITAVNAAALSGKLMQFANGAVYDEEKNYHVVHEAKLDALEELVEAADGPVMIAYHYQHDLDRISKRLKAYKPRMLKTKKDEADWKAGKIRVLLVHPASVGHGLNLQSGGHILIWFANTFSLELYMQLNKRLHRNGQKHPVLIYHLVTVGTRDEDCIEAVARKDETQAHFMESLKARIKQIKNR